MFIDCVAFHFYLTCRKGFQFCSNERPVSLQRVDNWKRMVLVFFSRTTVGQFQPNLTGIEFVCMTWCITCGTNDIPRYKHSLLKTIFLFNYNNDCTLLLTITYNAGNACADPEKFVLMLGSIAPTCPCKSTHRVFKRGGVTVHVLYCLYLAMYFLEY